MSKKITLFTGIIVLTTLSVAIADGNEQNKEELISRNKAKIEKAGSGDWKTFADCANTLISKRIATKEVFDWINHSIKIKETIFNRVVKGDYHALKGEIREAQAEYVRAIELARKTGKHSEIAQIQWKIMISMGIENYNNFHADKQGQPSQQ